MASLNKVEIIGRLGKDPEIRYTQSGAATVTMSVATDEGYTDKKTGQKVEATEWHRVVVWNKLAEICGQYLKKGSQVYVDGSNRTRKWTDQAGMDRYTTEVKARQVQFLDSRNSQQQAPVTQPPTAQTQSAQTPPTRQPQQTSTPDDGGPVFPSEVSGLDDAPF